MRRRWDGIDSLIRLGLLGPFSGWIRERLRKMGERVAGSGGMGLVQARCPWDLKVIRGLPWVLAAAALKVKTENEKAAPCDLGCLEAQIRE